MRTDAAELDRERLCSAWIEDWGDEGAVIFVKQRFMFLPRLLGIFSGPIIFLLNLHSPLWTQGEGRDGGNMIIGMI